MLAKFETKSSRVKGVAFHPTRPWILCSLHDGQIQLWDYRVGTLLETFKEHTGPVRSVDFHSTQPLFVSGGDDYKVRVWNYNIKRPLFTLIGHRDYVRCVQFHSECPWIVSCSDDQIIRIWNWQSRECIAELKGHNHYVMSVQFHPHEDLIVSSSLDQTIRVWDISGLKQQKKTVPSKNPGINNVMGRLGIESVVTVKYVLEGHERGVNWASFHPELPLIVSGSDDRMIKIWRTNDTKAWEVDTLRGHTGNVSCVLFHPREDLILSDSEDHSIRVWDSTKRVCVQTFARTRDRFWTITAHKTQNLIAAGHDSGTVVFKLCRERTPFAVLGKSVVFIHDHAYHLGDLESKKSKVILQITHGAAYSNKVPRHMVGNVHNPAEYMTLVVNREGDGSYELVRFPRDNKKSHVVPEVVSGTALSAVFISRTKFVTLESGDMLFIRNAENIVTKRIALPVCGCCAVMEGGCAGRVLLVGSDECVLFDTSSQQILGQVNVAEVKSVQWSRDSEFVCLVTKTGLMVCDRSLKLRCFLSENQRVKGAVWSAENVLVYATKNQLKFTLVDGEHGVLRSLEEPVYLVALKKRSVTVFTREGKLVELEIDPTEYLIKYHLNKKDYRAAIRLIQSCHVDSESIIGYLTRNGFEDIALHFVTEPRARFNLAIRCGNLDIAMESAAQLRENEVWWQLAEEALRQGNHEMVEMAYQQTKSFDRLSFLYVITGNIAKLQKMLRIADLRQDTMSRFHNALFLGDVEARVQVLLDVDQPTLAYLTAATYGLQDVAEQIRASLEEQGLAVPAVNPNASLLCPPVAVLQEGSWPLLELPRSLCDKIMEEEQQPADDLQDAFKEVEAAAEEAQEEAASAGEISLSEDDSADANAWTDDLDLGDDDSLVGAGGPAGAVESAVPPPRPSLFSQWCERSSLCADHAAAGDIATAASLLNRQIGVVSHTALLPLYRRVFAAAQPLTAGFPGMPALVTPVQRSVQPSLPFTPVALGDVTALVKKSLKAFQGAKFEACRAGFLEVFQSIPFVLAGSKQDEALLHQYLDLAREYTLTSALDAAKHQADLPTERALLLTYLMTHTRLQTAHLLLTLHVAMVAAFKAENFIDAALFATHILNSSEINSPKNASLAQKAKKVLAKSEKEGRNCVETGYKPDSPFAIECEELVPMKKEAAVECPYCGALYRGEKKGKVCCICKLAQVGVDTVGLVCTNSLLFPVSLSVTSHPRFTNATITSLSIHKNL